MSTSNGLEQHSHATEITVNGKDDVSVWELAGLLPDSRFELCVKIHDNVDQFLINIMSS